jgi:hypothetical protein
MWIVNALYWLRITDQLFESYFLHEWCILNRLFDYYKVKLKKKTLNIKMYGLECCLESTSIIDQL